MSKSHAGAISCQGHILVSKIVSILICPVLQRPPCSIPLLQSWPVSQSTSPRPPATPQPFLTISTSRPTAQEPYTDQCILAEQPMIDSERRLYCFSNSTRYPEPGKKMHSEIRPCHLVMNCMDQTPQQNRGWFDWEINTIDHIDFIVLIYFIY